MIFDSIALKDVLTTLIGITATSIGFIIGLILISDFTRGDR